MKLETEGWVMKTQVVNLCQRCDWRVDQGAMSTCSVYEPAWPNAKRCPEYQKDEKR